MAQEPNRDQEDIAPCDKISVLDQYEHWQRMHSQAMCHMLGVQANAATRKGIAL